MGKLAVLATQSHGVLTCACDCVAKNARLPIPAEIKPPQTTQNCGNDGTSSTVISKTDLTQQVRYFPRQPRTPILPQRPPDSWSTSYLAGSTHLHLQTPVWWRLRQHGSSGSGGGGGSATAQQWWWRWWQLGGLSGGSLAAEWHRLSGGAAATAWVAAVAPWHRWQWRRWW